LAETVLSARRRKARILASIFLVFGCACVAGAAWFSRLASHERAVWLQGSEGRLLKLGGKVETRSELGVKLFYDYRLDVVYADAEGTERATKVEFETVWKPVDTKAPASIRYLAADPAHPTLSWAIDAGGWRWGMPALMAALALLFLFAAISAPRMQARAEASLRAAAEDGEEVLHPLLSLSSYRGNWTVRYESAPGVKATASSRDAPLIVEREGRKHVVALHSPRSRAPVLVPEDLRLFDFDADTREQIGQRVRG
jgi:hypothetical protein